MSGKGGKGDSKSSKKSIVLEYNKEGITKREIKRSARKGTYLEQYKNKIPLSLRKYFDASTIDAVNLTEQLLAQKVYDRILSEKGVGWGTNELHEIFRKLIALKKAFRNGKIFTHAHDFDYNMSGNWGKECHEALIIALESSSTLFDKNKALENFERIIKMPVFETISENNKIMIREHLLSANSFTEFFAKLNSIKTIGVSITGMMWMELFNVGFGICEFSNVGTIIEEAKTHIELKSGGLPANGIIVSAGIIEIIGPIYPGEVTIHANRVLDLGGYAVISNEVTSAHKDNIFEEHAVSVTFGDSTTDFFRNISINFGSPKPGNIFPSNTDFHFTDNTNYPATKVISILEEYFRS